MNKKILVSLSVIGAVAAIAVGGTIAYFSDTETSTGNTFTAGSIDLKVDSKCTYNSEASDECGSWDLKDLVGDIQREGEIILGDRFFNFSDVKPGDSGENTISLHVYDNDAWVCAEVSNLANDDNGLTEPEGSDGDETDGVGYGELQDYLEMMIWRDNYEGEGYEACDNVYQEGEEQPLAYGYPVNGVLPVYDSTTGTGALEGDTTACLGVAWTLPAETGNIVQTDSLTGDISFYVEQARNNASFTCIPQPPQQ